MGLEARDNSFFLDGQPLHLISGAMHYFRVVPEYWLDRMQKMKACGLNCLETYVPWNLHEKRPGEFDYDGILDIRAYIKQAASVGLYVILRPGPYICAEWDFGGLPSWLLLDDDMRVRTDHPGYLKAVDRYLASLLPLVKDLQHSEGGPIIAVQLENEYGSYESNAGYKDFLMKKYQEYGVKELLFTSDNGMGIKRGEFGKELITANFQALEHGTLLFEYLSSHKQPGKPLMVMEFWTGWFDHWGEKHAVWPTAEYEKVLRFILEKKASVNFYMFHGGTNFGFMAGANQGLGATNEGNKNPYQADVTSYDYDAPIAEDGSLTDKWFLTRALLQEYLPEQVSGTLKGRELPDGMVAKTPATAYDNVKFVGSLSLEQILQHTQPMEAANVHSVFGQSYGYRLYRTKVKAGSKLSFPGSVRDRAIVYIDGRERAVLDATQQTPMINLGPLADARLDVIVENMGRVNYAEFRTPVLNSQRKGLIDAKLDGKALDGPWQIYQLDFAKDFLACVSQSEHWSTELQAESQQPVLLKFTLHVDAKPSDTFLNMKAMGKGVVFVNGFNLGRYWEIGPQETLYIPGPLLKEGDNEVLVFELHKPRTTLTFQAQPSLGPERIHTLLEGASLSDRVTLFVVRNAIKLGRWVWKPLELFM